MLRESSSFVALENDEGEMTVSAPAAIPNDSGFCWVSSVVKTPGAGTFDAVLIVDTAAGGELCGGYVWDGEWFGLDELVSHLAGAKRRDVYPFDYSLSVPLAIDHYH